MVTIEVIWSVGCVLNRYDRGKRIPLLFIYSLPPNLC